MRNTKFDRCALTVFALSVSSMAYAGDGAGTYSGYELSKDAQFTMDEASIIALKMHPRGVITERSLERVTGGTNLRYLFDVKAEATTFQVGVDANTGDVIEDLREVPN